jgi:hypothetical protein
VQMWLNTAKLIVETINTALSHYPLLRRNSGSPVWNFLKAATLTMAGFTYGAIAGSLVAFCIFIGIACVCVAIWPSLEGFWLAVTIMFGIVPLGMLLGGIRGVIKILRFEKYWVGLKK